MNTRRYACLSLVIWAACILMAAQSWADNPQNDLRRPFSAEWGSNEDLKNAIQVLRRYSKELSDARQKQKTASDRVLDRIQASQKEVAALKGQLRFDPKLRADSKAYRGKVERLRDFGNALQVRQSELSRVSEHVRAQQSLAEKLASDLAKLRYTACPKGVPFEKCTHEPLRRAFSKQKMQLKSRQTAAAEKAKALRNSFDLAKKQYDQQVGKYNQRRFVLAIERVKIGRRLEDERARQEDLKAQIETANKDIADDQELDAKNKKQLKTLAKAEAACARAEADLKALQGMSVAKLPACCRKSSKEIQQHLRTGQQLKAVVIIGQVVQAFSELPGALRGRFLHQLFTNYTTINSFQLTATLLTKSLRATSVGSALKEAELHLFEHESAPNRDQAAIAYWNRVIKLLHLLDAP